MKIINRRLKVLAAQTNHLSDAQIAKAIRALEKRSDGLSRVTFGLEQNMKEGFKRMDEQFRQIDLRFEQIDRRFDRLESHIDAFMKRTETNERETLFLGRQHDDLAKYCTKKIGYPTYGRNL